MRIAHREELTAGDNEMSAVKIETYDSTADEHAKKLASSANSSDLDRQNFVDAVLASAKESTDIIIKKITENSNRENQ